MGAKFHVNLYVIEENMVSLSGTVYEKILKINFGFTQTISLRCYQNSMFLEISYIIHWFISFSIC